MPQVLRHVDAYLFHEGDVLLHGKGGQLHGYSTVMSIDDSTTMWIGPEDILRETQDSTQKDSACTQ